MNRTNRGFVQIPNDIVRDGHGLTNIAVLAVVVSHGKCTASALTLAEELGCNEKTVRRALKYWKTYAAYSKDLTWHQEDRNGTTSIIRVEFPDLATSTTARETEGVGQPVQTPRAESPTKKNPEEESLKNEEQKPITPEERRLQGIRMLQEGMRKKKDFLETDVGGTMLRSYGLTAEEVLASGSP